MATRLRIATGQHSNDVAVDCMDLTFIDAAGLLALIQVHAELAQEGRDPVLVHPSPLLTRMLQVLDLTYLLRTTTPLPSQQSGTEEEHSTSG